MQRILSARPPKSEMQDRVNSKRLAKVADIGVAPRGTKRVDGSLSKLFPHVCEFPGKWCVGLVFDIELIDHKRGSKTERAEA